MDENSLNCPGCGARQPRGRARCGLCGTHLAAGEKEGGSVASSLPCLSCNTSNPANSRFCMACGAPLRHPEDRLEVAGKATVPDDSGRPHGKPTRLTLAVILVGLFSVALLFVVDTWSRRSDSLPLADGPSTNAFQGAGAEIQQRIQTLEAEIASTADSTTRMEKVTALVPLYARVGRPDKAGDLQRVVAQSANTAEQWARAGDYYYDWLRLTAEAEWADYAGRAIEAYRRSLEIEPDNLDVRTDLGLSYQFVPEHKEKALPEIEWVLARDSTHVVANFNRGVMLARLGRLDQATRQFERVLRLVPEQSEIHLQAERWMATIRSPSGQ